MLAVVEAFPAGAGAWALKPPPCAAAPACAAVLAAGLLSFLPRRGALAGPGAAAVWPIPAQPCRWGNPAGVLTGCCMVRVLAWCVLVLRLLSSGLQPLAA